MIGQILLAAMVVPSTPALGTTEARCRPAEAGPAVILVISGLKDRAGSLTAEVYPDDDRDFLTDDKVLIAEGKVFRRITVPVPKQGTVELCIRVPSAGPYALAVTHHRDATRAFNFFSDGVGFPGNPRLGLTKPHASAARVMARDRPILCPIAMNYRRGLLSFGPLGTGN